MKHLLRITLALSLALLGAPSTLAQSQAQELQGVSFSGQIYTLDFMTGEVISNGNCGFTNLGSQARSQNGGWWTVRSDTSNADLISLDSNGNGTLVTPLTVNGIVQSLAFSEAEGILYAFTASNLYKIDPSNGDHGIVGSTNLTLPSGATFLPSGELVAWNSSATAALRGLYLVDEGSGDSIQLSSLQPSMAWLAADSNGRIVGGNSSGSLWDIDSNGVASYASQAESPAPLLGADFLVPRPAFTQGCTGYVLGSGCGACPCGNGFSPRNIGGCLNSEGESARLLPRGSESVSAADLRFEVRNAKTNSFALLLSGSAIAPTNAANPCFGLDSGVQSPVLDGLRCAVQNLQRHGARPVDANGSVGSTTNGWGPPNGPMNGIAAASGFTPGQTRHFQVFYRDLTHGSCQTEVNTTQVVSVPFSN